MYGVIVAERPGGVDDGKALEVNGYEGEITSALRELVLRTNNQRCGVFDYALTFFF